MPGSAPSAKPGWGKIPGASMGAFDLIDLPHVGIARLHAHLRCAFIRSNAATWSLALPSRYIALRFARVKGKNPEGRGGSTDHVHGDGYGYGYDYCYVPSIKRTIGILRNAANFREEAKTRRYNQSHSRHIEV